jgi:hypothetical protein
VRHALHAPRGTQDRLGIANIGADELDIVPHVGEAPQRASRIVVDYAHPVTRFHQAPREMAA